MQVYQANVTSLQDAAIRTIIHTCLNRHEPDPLDFQELS